MQINAARREIYFKLVYYGPGLSGKTTNIQVIHKKAPADRKGPLTAIATEGDRTLFFDYMPLELGAVNGLRTKFQLYSVPGQKYYDATRKLVLQGVDGVCFVADSQPEKMPENVEALENLILHLKEQGLSIGEVPLVLQWNKRDLPDAMPADEMDLKLNKWGAPTFEAVAVTGEGVFPTLKRLASMVLEKLAKQQPQRGPAPDLLPPRSGGRSGGGPPEVPVPVAAPITEPAPAPVEEPPPRPSAAPRGREERRSLLRQALEKVLHVLFRPL